MTESSSYRYNYVMFNMNDDFIKAVFIGLSRLQNVQLCSAALPRGNNAIDLIHRFYWSNKINRRVKVPLKSIWFRRMYSARFLQERPLCFIYLGGKYAIDDYGFTTFVREQDPRNRQAVIFGDLINKSKNQDLTALKKKVDLIITYDKAEAEKYGIVYHPLNALSPLVEVTEPDHFNADVFFIGYAKDRYDDIFAVWESLSSKGIRCDFLVARVPKEKRVHSTGIHYLDRPLPYLEAVKRMNRSKCVLEIVQKGSTGATLRTREAIVYRRKLLSNAASLLDDPHYNPAQMSVFTTPESIDIDFIRAPMDYANFENGDNLSPENILRFIEQYFLEHGHAEN